MLNGLQTADILKLISIIVAILAVGLSVIGLYLGYVSFTLNKRIRECVDRELSATLHPIQQRLHIRLELIDAVMQTMLTMDSEEARGHVYHTRVYALQHVLRLTTGDEADMCKALAALKGLGTEAAYLVPYVERIRAVAGWPPCVETQYRQFLGRLS